MPDRAANFIDDIGVNTHLGLLGSPSTAIIADMAFLGLTSIRNAAPKSATPNAERGYAALAAAGLKFDFICSGPIKASLKAIDALLTASPGAVAAIEGPNEVNNFPFSYHGKTGAAAAVRYQAALFKAVKADPLLADVPVLNFTDAPYTPGPADVANGHPYPKNGEQPLSTLTAAFDKLQAAQPGLSVDFTETGYSTLPGAYGWGGVDGPTQAKMTLNLIMDAARLGVASTYLYDLIDDGADPAQDTFADHFGLFTNAGGAKPSAVAIHDLTTILADPGAQATTFTTSPLPYSVSGLPADGASLILEKSSGVYDIVVWAEPQIWDAATSTPITVAPVSVTVNLGAAAQTVQVYDPLLSSMALSTASDAQSATLALTDHPLIIQVSNFAAAAAGVSGGAANAAISSSATPAPPSLVNLLAAPGASG